MCTEKIKLGEKIIQNHGHGQARYKQRGARYVGCLLLFFFLVSAEVQALGASSSAVAENKPNVLAVRRFPDQSQARQPLKARRAPFPALMCLQCHRQIRATQCPNKTQLRASTSANGIS